jgi:hypothetical protein
MEETVRETGDSHPTHHLVSEACHNVRHEEDARRTAHNTALQTNSPAAPVELYGDHPAMPFAELAAEGPRKSACCARSSTNWQPTRRWTFGTSAMRVTGKLGVGASAKVSRANDWS